MRYVKRNEFRGTVSALLLCSGGQPHESPRCYVQTLRPRRATRRSGNVPSVPSSPEFPCFETLQDNTWRLLSLSSVAGDLETFRLSPVSCPLFPSPVSTVSIVLSLFKQV
jgi:hypothetical protein